MTPSEWIEVNIPASAEERTGLLLDVVDPLVHEKWEPELRLRIRWADPESADSARAQLAVFLDSAKADGKLEDWYEGSTARGARSTAEKLSFTAARSGS